MANTIFVADNTMPGQAAVDLLRPAADAIVAGAFASTRTISGMARDYKMRQQLRTVDRAILRDLGLDRSAC